MGQQCSSPCQRHVVAPNLGQEEKAQYEGWASIGELGAASDQPISLAQPMLSAPPQADKDSSAQLSIPCGPSL